MADVTQDLQIPEAHPSTPQKWLRPASLSARAVPRWLAVCGVLGILSLLYLVHPYYRGPQFTPWRFVFPALASGWLLFGFFWTRMAMKRFGKPVDAFLDTGLSWLIIWRWVFGYTKLKIYRGRRFRNTVLGLVVKAFFGPLMVGFFGGHWQALGNLWLGRKGSPALPLLAPGATLDATLGYVKNVSHLVWAMLPRLSDMGALFEGGVHLQQNLRFWVDVSYNGVFIVDCGVALVGYLLETRFFGNKTKSVESTWLGWIAALACYPPYNSITGIYLPFGNSEHPWIDNPWIILGLRALMVAFFVVYAAATVSFGAKFSNLTNRGIISRGPYAVIRHPAYTCKCIAWWLENLPTLTGQTAVSLACLCGIYALRAWTEERHLAKDPEYRVYQKKVRWVAIPGLF